MPDRAPDRPTSATRGATPAAGRGATTAPEELPDLHPDVRRLLDSAQAMARLCASHRRPLADALGAMPDPTAEGEPQLEAVEAGDDLHLVARLPGLHEGEVEAWIDGDLLTIRAERRMADRPLAAGACVAGGRASVEWAVRLPRAVEPGAVRAAFADGALRLTFPGRRG